MSPTWQEGQNTRSDQKGKKGGKKERKTKLWLFETNAISLLVSLRSCYMPAVPRAQCSPGCLPHSVLGLQAGSPWLSLPSPCLYMVNLAHLFSMTAPFHIFQALPLLSLSPFPSFSILALVSICHDTRFCLYIHPSDTHSHIQSTLLLSGCNLTSPHNLSRLKGVFSSVLFPAAFPASRMGWGIFRNGQMGRTGMAFPDLHFISFSGV